MQSLPFSGQLYSVADLASQATRWPVSLPSTDSNHFISTIPPLSCSNDFVRFIPGRPILLDWTSEGVVELGVGHSLDSMDISAGRGMITIRLARTNFTAGISVVIPLERYWAPFACIPTYDESDSGE